MKAAIDVLARMPAPRIFVMGDMGELGEDEAAAMHAEVGAYARDQGIEAAYFVGDNSVEAAETFGADGLWFAAKDPLIQVLSHRSAEGASVLVKGSRFMAMEEVPTRWKTKRPSENGKTMRKPLLLKFIVCVIAATPCCGRPTRCCSCGTSAPI